MSAFVEENVVKNRLLFDGDGNGDDRRLNMLLKLTTKWGHATNPNGDPEEDIKVKLPFVFYTLLSTKIIIIRIVVATLLSLSSCFISLRPMRNFVLNYFNASGRMKKQN